MFRAHQSCCATRRGSCKIVKIRSASLSASLFAKVALQNRSERSSRGSWSVSWATRESFLTTPSRSWPTQGVPRSALGRHLGVEQPSQARPDATPNRLWTYESAPNRFFADLSWILASFSLIFERFFVDFRSSRLRRGYKIGVSKRSRGIFTTRRGCCVLQSRRIARMSFAMTFEHYMFKLFSGALFDCYKQHRQSTIPT